MAITNIRKAIKSELGIDVPKNAPVTNEQLAEGMVLLHREMGDLIKHVNERISEFNANQKVFADVQKDWLDVMNGLSRDLYDYVGETYNKDAGELKRIADEAFGLMEALTCTLAEFKAAGLPVPRELREAIADKLNANQINRSTNRTDIEQK